MGNIYDVASAIQQPNVVGNFNQGVQTAQQNQVFGQKQAAYQQALSDQQNIRSLAPQVIAGDPNATAQVAAIDPSQAASLQTAGNTQLARLSGAINYLDQQTTPEAKEAAYQTAVKPYLAQLGAASGKQPPASFVDAQPAMEAARAQIAQLGQSGAPAPVKVGANEALVDPSTGKPIYTNTQAPKPQLVQAADGSYVWATPGGSASPLTYGAQASNQPQGSIPPSLPAETQAYVPKVKALLNGAPAFDQSGQPTPQLMNSIQMVESGGNPLAVSPKGAQGAYQLMPGTAAQLGVTNPLDANQARQGAATYLAQLRQKFGNDDQAIAAYNAGPSKVAAALASTNQNGQPVMGPPKAGNFTTLTPEEVASNGLPVGTVAQRGANGKIDIVSKPDMNSSTVVAPGDPTKTGDAYLATLPPSMRGVVKAIADGDQAPPSASSRSPAAQSLLQAVYAYDPTASATNLPTRTAARKSFTSGKDAQNMTALSQLALHLDHLNDQVGQTSGIGLPLVGSGVNNAINAVVNSSQDPTTGGVTAFNSTSNAVAHELRAVFANQGGGTQAELEENLKQLDANNSTAQKKAAIQNIAQLVHGRFGVLQDKYSQAMGKTEDPFQAQYPGAESTILKLMGAGTAGDSQGQSAAPTGTPSGGGWAIQKVGP